MLHVARAHLRDAFSLSSCTFPRAQRQVYMDERKHGWMMWTKHDVALWIELYTCLRVFNMDNLDVHLEANRGAVLNSDHQQIVL